MLVAYEVLHDFTGLLAEALLWPERPEERLKSSVVSYLHLGKRVLRDY